MKVDVMIEPAAQTVPYVVAQESMKKEALDKVIARQDACNRKRQLIIKIFIIAFSFCYYILPVILTLTYYYGVTLGANASFVGPPPWNIALSCASFIVILITALIRPKKKTNLPLWLCLSALLVITALRLAILGYTSELRPLGSSLSQNDAEVALLAARDVYPQAQLKVTCFHQEPRSRTESYVEGGQIMTRIVNYTENVTSFAETRYVQFSGFYDDTKPVKLSGYPLVYIQMDAKTHQLGSTAITLQQLADQAVIDNQMKDSFTNVQTVWALSDPLPLWLSVMYGPESQYVGKSLLWTAAAFGFDTPIIIWARSKVPHVQLDVMKYVSSSPEYGAIGYVTEKGLLLKPSVIKPNSNPVFEIV